MRGQRGGVLGGVHGRSADAEVHRAELEGGVDVEADADGRVVVAGEAVEQVERLVRSRP